MSTPRPCCVRCSFARRGKDELRRRRAPAGSVAQPDAHHVQQHRQRVAAQRKRRGELVDQRDRNAAERQAQPVRQHDHLGVEGEAVDGRAAENLQRGAAAEQLQPALRVGHFARHHAADDLAEGERGQAASQPATGQMLRALDVAGAEDHVALAAADPLVALPQGRELEGQIGVGEGQHAAGGAEHGGPHGPALAALRRRCGASNSAAPDCWVSAAVRSVLPSSATSTR